MLFTNNQQYRRLLLLSLGCVATFSFFACEGSTTAPNNQHSEPRKFVLTLTDLSDATKTTTYSWSDADGSGGNAPTVDTMKLTSGKSYSAKAKVYDSNNNDITSTIESEADQHQFFYQPKDGAATRMTVAVTDKDKNSLPVGLAVTIGVLPGSMVSGALNVVLSHYDEVKKDGSTKSPESDIDIDFPVLIQ